MDHQDYKIIAYLMEQGRGTWAELAAIVGLSAPAVAERVRKLEEAGAIKGYSALVEPETIGCGLGAFISVIIEQPEYKQQFLERIKRLPEVLECHHLAGAEDYMLKVRCQGTQALERIISEEIKCLPGIKTRTTVILSTVKETSVMPVHLERR